MVRNRAGGESLLSTFQADDESGLRKIKSSNQNDDFMKKFFKSDGSIKAISKPAPVAEPKSEEIKEEITPNRPKTVRKEDFLKNFFGAEFDQRRNPKEKVILEEATYSKITVDIKMGSERKPSVTNYEPSALPRALSSEDFAEKFFKSNSASPISEPEKEALATPVLVPKAKEIARTKNEGTMLDVAFSPSLESSFSTIELELDSGFVQDFSSGNFEQEIEPELKAEIKEENHEQKTFENEIEQKRTLVVDAAPKYEPPYLEPSVEPSVIELEPEMEIEPELVIEPESQPELQLEPELILEPEVEPISELLIAPISAPAQQGAPFIIKSQIKISPGKAEVEALQLQNAKESSLQDISSLQNRVESPAEALLSELSPVSEANEQSEEAPFSPGPVSPDNFSTVVSRL
jgi:hypothetical protein